MDRELLMITSSAHRTAQSGFTLLEVLTAVVVLSVGLLGLGLLMATSVRSNHVGMLHTQASFVAESVLDRMRANIRGVWQDNYNGTYSGTGTAPTPDCTSGSPCNPAQVAARDTFAWGQLVAQLLPGGSGTVACQRFGPAPGPTEILTWPIYNGRCTITITWTELGESNDPTVPQSFVWVVQP